MSEASAIYLDNNATTALAPEALEAMLPWLRAACGNPSSQHRLGSEAARALAHARLAVARLLGAAGPEEVVFCSGGTEALATALHCALSGAGRRRRVLTSSIEHSALRAPLARLVEREGLRWSQVPVDSEGQLDRSRLQAELAQGEVALVALLYANNETGALLEAEALEDVGRLTHSAGALLLLDTVQAVGKVPLALARGPADYAALSAHKFHGPKGCGALWVRQGAPFDPLFVGGGQERDRRAGTENVPGIVGLGRAAELAAGFLADRGWVARQESLRDRLEQKLLEGVPGARVHARGSPRLWNTSSIAFPGLQAEALQALLDLEQVAVSTGAACSSGKHAPSHVLTGMGLAPELASASLRFSLSRSTSAAQIERALELTQGAVEALRQLAPQP